MSVGSDSVAGQVFNPYVNRMFQGCFKTPLIGIVSPNHKKKIVFNVAL